MNLYEKSLRRTLAIALCVYLLGAQVAITGFAVYDAISEPAEPSEVITDTIPEETEPPTEIDIPTEPAPTEPEPTEPEPTETEPAPTEPEPTKPEPTEPEWQYYDIPLDNDLQAHIFTLCEHYGIEPTIIFAMINIESLFIPDIIGDNGNSYGLMQIQARFCQDLMEELGCYDLLDPYQNVTVGIDIVASFFEYEKPLEWVLMAYNGGPGYANRKWANGEISDYVYLVLDLAASYELKEAE